MSGSPLTPKDAWQRATIRFLADRFDSKITGSLYGLLMETDPAKVGKRALDHVLASEMKEVSHVAARRPRLTFDRPPSPG